VCNICHKTVCCCKIPVIVQYGKKGNQGIPGKPKNALPSWWYKALIVDFTHGDNASAVKYSSTNPYKSFDAARLAAVSGDTIVFMPGTHEVDTGLLTGEGISIWAMPDSIINVNNAQVALAGTLNIQGDGEWHFFNDGINLDDVNELDVLGEYIFYFKDIYVHYSYGISTRVGRVKIAGKNIYIVDSGSTFFYANLWHGDRCDIDFDFLYDSVAHEDSVEYSSNIFIYSSSVTGEANVNISFKKIQTVRRQCIVYLSGGVNHLITNTVGDIVQVSDNSVDILGNSTVYISSVAKGTHNLYGKYQTNNPRCLISVSNTASNIPLKVYHEGSMNVIDGDGCVIVAGNNSWVKLRGIYAGGKSSFSSENATIITGNYSGYNILIGSGITSGGRVEVIGTIVNRHNGDSNEVHCIVDKGDTASTSITRLNNCKCICTVTEGTVAVFSENETQTIEIIGVLATNFSSGHSGYTAIGDNWVDVANYTDDEIF
jgi:hypothetical protein